MTTVSASVRRTYVVLAVGSGASQQQHLRALGVAVLTGQMQSRVSCLKQDGETGVRRSGCVRAHSVSWAAVAAAPCSWRGHWRLPSPAA